MYLYIFIPVYGEKILQDFDTMCLLCVFNAFANFKNIVHQHKNIYRQGLREKSLRGLQKQYKHNIQNEIEFSN